MTTLSEIERAVLGLSQVEYQRLAEWIEKLAQSRLRVAESRAHYPTELQYPMTVEEYLDYEAEARNRHEYIAGEIFAMSGASLRHNRIAGRLYRAFADHLQSGPCQPYMSEVKVKLRVNRDDCVYYPDVMVVCEHDSSEGRFVTNPKLIVEVLSPSTAGVDRQEKRYNYRWIPALEEYVVVAQDTPEIIVYRREEDWTPIVLRSLEETLELRSIGLALPLARVYEGEP